MTIEVPEDYTYLDWAATAPLCEEAAKAMAPFMETGAAGLRLNMNANSLHSPGRAAFEALEQARRSIAQLLGAQRPSEVVFTSGATEADNAALLGMARAAREARRKKGDGDACCKVVTSAIEHDAVLAPARRLKAEGFEVVFVKPDGAGFVTPEALSDALDGNTLLVSVQMANSEIGSVQPIAELARLSNAAGALFHTDAVQALGKVPVDVGALGVDAASFSGHKICGPKGIGVLYLKARTPFSATMLGGGQEAGLRSGTQNVCGAVGLEAALRATCALGEEEAARQRTLRDALYARLADIGRVKPTVGVEAGSHDYLPNIVHVLVDGFESETLVLRLDLMGFGVSGGSACASHSLEPSHVLKAIGVSTDAAYGALRISIGRYTTAEDVEAFADALAQCVGENPLT